jgi:hydrogenase maturation protease
MVATEAKLLVLGLGSTLLRDDGIGLLLLRAVEDRAERHWRDRVEFLDADTQRTPVLPEVADRAGLVILTVVALGAKAGTVHVLNGEQLDRVEAARELVADMRREYHENVFVVGVEPDAVRTGLGVSDPVAKVLHRAVDRAVGVIDTVLEQTWAGAEREREFALSCAAADV